MEYLLDSHGQELMQQYHERRHVYERIEQIACEALNKLLKQQGIEIDNIEHRIKTESSLAGKLELKGGKYASLSDITDIFGMRIVTFYSDDVDKVAAIVKRLFNVDWNESVDKRKLHQLTSFGYNSLHYICSIPKTIVDDPEMPELNEYRFEIQMRTALQHVWSVIEHDMGYKAGVKIPKEHRRQFSRLSGMLELVDEEFGRMRNTLTELHRKVQSLVANGQLSEVPLELSNFRKYLDAHPFDPLNERIASVNQAEIYPVPLLPYLIILQDFGFDNLGDVHEFIQNNFDDAYNLALSQLAVTDLDILASNVGIQNLCIVHILKTGRGLPGLKHFYDRLYGTKPENEELANIAYEQASGLSFMQKANSPE